MSKTRIIRWSFVAIFYCSLSNKDTINGLAGKAPMDETFRIVKVLLENIVRTNRAWITLGANSYEMLMRKYGEKEKQVKVVTKILYILA